MKNRAFAAIIFLLGAFVFISSAQGEPRLQGKNPSMVPFPGTAGQDMSQGGWQNWQAPVGTVDPDRLISSDSTVSTMAGVSPAHSDSIQSDSRLADAFRDGTPIQVEKPKLVETTTESARSAGQPAAALANAAPKAKSDSKRIVLIACISLAVLAYRKFRRANARPYPRKPSFL